MIFYVTSDEATKAFIIHTGTFLRMKGGVVDNLFSMTSGSISRPTCSSHVFTVLPYSTFFAMINLTFPFTGFGLFFLYFLVEQ